MSGNATGKVVHIADCADMHQPRASLTDGAMGHLGDAVTNPDASPSTLYASSDCILESVQRSRAPSDGLWAILGSTIAQGKYSYRDGTWHECADLELKFIERALRREY